MWQIISPDGRSRAEIEIAECGWPTLRLYRGGASLIERVNLALEASGPDGAEAPVFLDKGEGTIDECYSLPAGKLAEYESHGRELALSYLWRGMTLALRVRLYDAGLAFRWEASAGGGALAGREHVCFSLPEEARTVFAQELVSTYEGPYLARDWRDMPGQDYGMPLLVGVDGGGWLLFSEAEVLSQSGRWPSSHLHCTEERTLEIAPAPEDHGAPLALDPPFHSPWRIVTVGEDLNTLVRSHLCYDVNPPSAMVDQSWIRPARALWAWWEYENGAQLYSESKHYIDYAAAMGFECVVLDCPWDGNWVRTLCDYAHARNVQLWLWTSRHRVDTPETAQALIPLWASWGVDGLKIDFFENDSRDTMAVYNMLATLMEKHRLMINFHGATKPMGEGRTWPHLMTSEGIMGLEHYKWSNMPDSVHNCMVPFTRNVSGPMDYTPLGFSNANRNTTHAHQLALPVVFESGVTHYSLSIHYMEPWSGTRFIRRTKARYDECRLLSGYPGRDVVMMRRAENEYLIGAITTRRQICQIPLNFLPEGEWQAEIYEDDSADHWVTVRTQTVTRETVLRLPLLENGGAGVYIARTLEKPAGGFKGGWADANASEIPLETAQLHGGAEFVNVVQGVKGLLLDGAAVFCCRAPKAGLYTLRVTYSSLEPWQLSAGNGADACRVTMPASRSHWDLRVHDATVRLHEGLNRLCLERANGDKPCLTRLRLIDNEPQSAYRLSVEQARLGRGAELREVFPGVWEAVRLGGDADLTFRPICVPKAGRYILNIEYAGGDARDISISTNGGASIDTYLHPTSGWGFAHWERVEGKEVLVELGEGENEIRLFNDKGPMSHIRGITLTLDAR